MGEWDLGFPSDWGYDWSALGMNIFIGIMGFILLLVGGFLMLKLTPKTFFVGLILFIAGGASLAWALGLI